MQLPKIFESLILKKETIFHEAQQIEKLPCLLHKITVQNIKYYEQLYKKYFVIDKIVT